MDEWESKKEEILVVDFDGALEAYASIRTKYDEAKAKASELYVDVLKRQQELLSLLTRSGKSSWKVPGVGTASKKVSLSVKTPKTKQAKESFFNFLKGYNEDVYWKLLSPNSRSLNSFYNEMAESNPEIELPGLELPTSQESLSFRKS